MNSGPRQQALTLACPVSTTAREALRSELAELNAPLQKALSGVPTLHFARFLLLPAAGLESELLFEAGFDGLVAPFLDALWATAGRELGQLFGHCEPIDSGAVFQRFAARYTLRAEAAHTAHEELSASVIRNDAALDRLLQTELDRAQPGEALADHGPFEIACALQSHARATPGAWLGSVSRTARPHSADRLAPIRRRIFDVLLAAALIPPLELGYSLSSLLRGRGESTRENGARPALRAGGAVAQVVAVKPGRLRLFLLRLVLWLVHGWFSERRQADGHALSHVHNLRWFLRPGPNLVLLARTDFSPATLLAGRSSWERRLSSLIWLQTVGFPLGFSAVLTGSRREAALLRWLGGSLLTSDFWFSAYPSLTVGEIERNHRLRELLSRELDHELAGELCALL